MSLAFNYVVNFLPIIELFVYDVNIFVYIYIY